MDRSVVDLMEDRIDAFEQARALDPTVALSEFLPPVDDPDYPSIALEMMRIELENSWQEGNPKSLKDYQLSFHDVLRDRQRLGELAFEEYRCRLQAGADVSPQEYADRFEISIDQWPASEDENTDRWPWQSLETVDDLGSDSKRIVDAIQLFPQEGDNYLNFQLVETLGQGTFGTVFLAKQAELADRPVVLKISAGHSVEPAHLARLQHTNIVPIYSTHEQDRLQAVCMPYFGRTTLADVVKSLQDCESIPNSGQFIVEVIFGQSGQTSIESHDRVATTQLETINNLSYVDAVVEICLQVVAGLEHAHQRGILHRDIKPANVLLTDDGQPMLLDFNVSDEIVVGGRACVMVGGTWPYMSPEQRRAMTSGQAIDQRSDIFSVGVLLYQLFCAQLPNHEDASQPPLPAMQHVVPVTIDQIQRQNPRVPRSVAAIVCRCLSPDRDQRYQSVSEVKDDLERHLDHRPLRFVPDRSPVERIRKWCRRHPRILSTSTISAVAASLVIIAAIVALVRDQQFKRIQAVALSRTIDQELPELRVLFGSREIDAGIESEATDRALRLIRDIDPQPTSRWVDQAHVRHLNGPERNALRDDLAELYFLVADAEVWQAGPTALVPERLNRAQELNEFARRLFEPDQVPAALIDQQTAFLTIRDEPTASARDSLRHSNAWASSGERLMFAQQLMLRGDYSSAITHLENLRAAQPFDFSVWFLLGNCYVSLARLSDADGCFTTCVSLWPDSYLSWFNRGLCRFQLRQFELAKQDFGQVLELRPDFAPALFNRALCEKGAKNFASAIDDLTQVLSLQGRRSRTLLVRARVYEQMGEDALAQADRDAALETEPADAKGWMARGLARVGDQPELALQDLQRAQELTPHARQVARNLAYVYGEHLEQPQAAADILDSLIQRFGDPEDMMARAVMLARLGQYQAGIQQGTQALDARRDGKLVFQMACIYALVVPQDSSTSAKAAAHLAEAISLDPSWLSKAIGDPDLNAIRQSSEYRVVMQAALTLQRKIRSIHRTNSRGSK